MVAHRLEAVHQVVQPERGHHERPVRLVAVGTAHGSAPEVVGEKRAPWRLGPQVFVLLHGGLVVEADAAFERVGVHAQRNQRTEQPRGRG